MNLTFEVTINEYLTDLGLYHVEIWNGQNAVEVYMNDNQLRDNNDWGYVTNFNEKDNL